MGFRPETTIYKLNFDGGWLNGLMVRVRCCTVKEFNEMLRWQADPEVSVADSNEKVLALFLQKLEEWNLEMPDGTPAPHTPEACDVQEQPVLREILTQWQRAMANVPDPLSNSSNSGGDSLERSLGMA